MPSFYENLPRAERFEDMADASAYHALPSDWVVGLADVKNSTQAIAAGKYKTINMVGAAVISAQINGMGGQAFPFIFGGDGAAFAVAPQHQVAAARALSAVSRWAKSEFDVDLRVAIVPVTEITGAGKSIGVARFQASKDVDYAMFGGGGLSWAETQMKAGHYVLPPSGDDAPPDLTGLSCRWSPIKSKNGSIVSLVLQPAKTGDPKRYGEVVQHLLSITRNLDRGGHPVPVDGPKMSLRLSGAKLESRTQTGAESQRKAYLDILKEISIAWLGAKTGKVFGGFDGRKYAHVLGLNTDFRKFDDGLKMTLDCDQSTFDLIEKTLAHAEQDGVLNFGLHQQAEAMVTCIVPSYLQDDHIHFVDGASGGYTQAAARIKSELKNQ